MLVSLGPRTETIACVSSMSFCFSSSSNGMYLVHRRRAERHGDQEVARRRRGGGRVSTVTSDEKQGKEGKGNGERGWPRREQHSLVCVQARARAMDTVKTPWRFMGIAGSCVQL